jgi:hypothetical protein
MLTDIFARRYQETVLWQAHSETESRLLVQAFGLVEEVMPLRARDGSEIYGASDRWTRIHDALSRELGVHELSARSDGWGHRFPMDMVCKTFVTDRLRRGADADRFVKERLSFIEIAFRTREGELAAFSATLPERILNAKMREAARAAALNKIGKARVEPEASVERLTAEVDEANCVFRQRVAELNERFRQAGTHLNYHNGLIQLRGDDVTEREIETPFWSVVAAAKWKNVDTDMKEAIDRCDAKGRDPALYAAKALESTIKIISDDKGWTTGGERGAHNYIDNLGAEQNGQFIAPWERDALKAIFTQVRNPLGHGPGNEVMPALTTPQTNWAIETCMSWIKTLIQRT